MAPGCWLALVVLCLVGAVAYWAWRSLLKTFGGGL